MSGGLSAPPSSRSRAPDCPEWLRRAVVVCRDRHGRAARCTRLERGGHDGPHQRLRGRIIGPRRPPWMVEDEGTTRADVGFRLGDPRQLGVRPLLRRGDDHERGGRARSDAAAHHVHVVRRGHGPGAWPVHGQLTQGRVRVLLGLGAGSREFWKLRGVPPLHHRTDARVAGGSRRYLSDRRLSMTRRLLLAALCVLAVSGRSAPRGGASPSRRRWAGTAGTSSAAT